MTATRDSALEFVGGLDFSGLALPRASIRNIGRNLALQPANAADTGTQEASSPSGTTSASVSPIDQVRQNVNESFIVGSSIVSFDAGVTPERRKAALRTTTAASLYAKQQALAGDASRPNEFYLDALAHFGWDSQASRSGSYDFNGNDLEVNQAVGQVIQAITKDATAIALATQLINSLQSMDKDDPWITLFNEESQQGQIAQFLVSLAHQGANDDFLLDCLGFKLSARRTVVQVLFFKMSHESDNFSYNNDSYSLDDDIYNAIRDELTQKIIGFDQQFVGRLNFKGVPRN
ncbi:MAG: hypothetical protein WDN25_30085 [Acetobacteraceae bacterium]